jgi:hypothetical protein
MCKKRKPFHARGLRFSSEGKRLMTRREMINRYIDENRAKKQADAVAAEAERYRDKQMDEPATPQPPALPQGVVWSRFGLGVPVQMRYDPNPVPGIVTEIAIRLGAVVYGVTWCDSRCQTCHYEFEIEALPDNDLGSPI